ncbi:MAG: hypothetical protein COB12_12935 [Flavobacterium sp.]|nr:MAG: hypothetical protein COB12_12935 [Flavobacterium sp.]
MKKIITLIMLFVASLSFGQILDEQFNNNSQFTTSTPFFSDGFSDYFGLAVVNDFNGDSNPNNLKAYTGFSNGFLTGMDLNGEGASLPITITWSNLDITGLGNLEFSGEFAEFFDSPGDIDAADFILLEYQIDGGTFQNLIAFEGADFTSGSSNGNFREDTDFDGTGDGLQLTGASLTFNKTIVGSGTTLNLRMTVSVNSGDEDFAVDNFIITGNNANGTPPVIACAPDVIANNDAGLCSAVVIFVDAIATDVDGDLDTVLQTMGPISGSVFPNGDTIIEYTATDLAGNTSTCQFTITVNDAELPMAICQNFTVTLDSLGIATILPSDLDGGSTDNCAVFTLAVNQATFTCADIGDVTVTLSVFDEAGNEATCNATVTVIDNTVPIISCVGTPSTGIEVFINEFHYNNPGADIGEFIEIAGPAGTDLSGWAIWKYNGNNGQNYNGEQLLTGVIDDEGNGFGALSFDVGTLQNGGPDGFALVNENGVVVQFLSYEGDFIAIDGPASGMQSEDIGVEEAGSGAPIGESLQLSGTGSFYVDFTWNNPLPESPGSLNSNQILQIPPPVSALDIVLDANGMLLLPASDLIGSVDEACNYTVTVNGNTDVVFDCSMLGESEVEVTVTDASGNFATCNATVNVIDNTAPVLACADVTLELEEDGTLEINPEDLLGFSLTTYNVITISSDNQSGTEGFTDLTVTVTDAASISFDWDYTTTDGPAFDSFGILLNGVYTEISDPVGANTQSGNYGLNVVPGDVFGFRSYSLDGGFGAATTTVSNFIPGFTGQFAPANWTELLINSDGSATFVEIPGGPLSYDACGITVLAIDINEVTCADIGTPIVITVFASDASGNIAACQATVTVVDLLAPVLTCPEDQTQDPGPGNLFWEVPDYWANGEATATDNCTDPVVITTQDPAAGTLLPDGTYTVTITAEDEYGNVSTCDFELIIDSQLGLEDQQDLASIILYPNPVNNIVYLSNPNSLELESLSIYDLTGRLVNVTELEAMGTEISIDVSKFANATYMVVVRGINGTLTKQLIVNNY